MKHEWTTAMGGSLCFYCGRMWWANTPEPTDDCPGSSSRTPGGESGIRTHVTGEPVNRISSTTCTACAIGATLCAPSAWSAQFAPRLAETPAQFWLGLVIGIALAVVVPYAVRRLLGWALVEGS